MRFLRAAPLLLALASPAAAQPARAPRWAAASQSPRPVRLTDLSDRESELLARCGAGDVALREVARRVLERKLAGLPYLDLDGLSFAQRQAGEPHVWPRAWIVSGRALDHESVVKKLDAWRATFRDLGERRCGVAMAAAPDGSEIVAAVSVDALADLAPLPTRARVAQLLTIDATMLVPATGARVVVLGPSGAPRTVPTSFHGSRVFARFAPERPGAFTVQVVVDVETGPRPVLEARVFAEMDPPDEVTPHAAPGEDAGPGAGDGADALVRMVQAVRAAEGLRAVVRDSRLDALARAHAARMRAARTVGHDAGDGDPALRVRDAGLDAREAGENVAHAPTVALAHRALWASPSHRANLLKPEFDHVGAASLEDRDGTVWVVELFASGLR